jgi:hypothetical protein
MLLILPGASLASAIMVLDLEKESPSLVVGSTSKGDYVFAIYSENS